ncbi:hypothetical protein FRB98_000509 [Tulasnella sp. 332]|nr:hypothetical protein FRB98_000509 [Tulasnella sp. 332]
MSSERSQAPIIITATIIPNISRVVSLNAALTVHPQVNTIISMNMIHLCGQRPLQVPDRLIVTTAMWKAIVVIALLEEKRELHRLEREGPKDHHPHRNHHGHHHHKLMELD